MTNDNKCEVTQHPAYNIDKSVYSPTKPQRIRVGSESMHDVESGDRSEETFRVLYKIHPTAALFAIKSLFGVEADSRPNIQAVHLGFDPVGKVIRDLYVENNEILRVRLSDSGSGKQISETRLYPDFDKSDRLKGTVSPDGKHVAIVNQQKLTILESKFGEVLREWDVVPHVEAIIFDHSGEYVAIAAGKRSRHWAYEIHFDKLQVYRVATGEAVWSESRKGIQGFGFQPQTNQLYVLTSGDENQLRFFDRDTWQETWRHATSHAPAYGMAMSSTGQEIAIGLRDSRLEFWKLSDVKKANSP
jgi:WD40 repeat protein